MKKNNFKNKPCGTNAVVGAKSTAKSFGFGPVARKGGATTNYAAQATVIQREFREK